MRRTYKPLFWRTTHPVNSMDCMTEGRYCLKRIIFDKFIIYFIKYFHSFIQSAVFTGRVAHQNNGLYVLRMIVKLAFCDSVPSIILRLVGRKINIFRIGGVAKRQSQYEEYIFYQSRTEYNVELTAQNPN